MDHLGCAAGLRRDAMVLIPARTLPSGARSTTGTVGGPGRQTGASPTCGGEAGRRCGFGFGVDDTGAVNDGSPTRRPAALERVNHGCRRAAETSAWEAATRHCLASWEAAAEQAWKRRHRAGSDPGLGAPAAIPLADQTPVALSGDVKATMPERCAICPPSSGNFSPWKNAVLDGGRRLRLACARPSRG